MFRGENVEKSHDNVSPPSHGEAGQRAVGQAEKHRTTPTLQSKAIIAYLDLEARGLSIVGGSVNIPSDLSLDQGVQKSIDAISTYIVARSQAELEVKLHDLELLASNVREIIRMGLRLAEIDLYIKAGKTHEIPGDVGDYLLYNRPYNEYLLETDDESAQFILKRVGQLAGRINIERELERELEKEHRARLEEERNSKWS